MSLTLELARIDNLFATWDSRQTPGVSVAIAQGESIVYQRGFGMSNLEHDVPISLNSIFHVASISKQFTDMCIAILVNEGRITLDDDVRRYVPELPTYDRPIAIRNLIYHTSGLRDQWDLLSLAGWRDDIDLINEGDVLWIAARQAGVNFAPGERYSYCNTAYTLLAVIIKRVSGQSLREFAHERIFVPLGMIDTHVHDNHAEIVPRRTQAYRQRGEGGYEICVPVFDVAGTTSLFTTTGDLVRWSTDFVRQRVGGPEAWKLMFTRGKLNDGRTLDYAFGLAFRSYKGVELIEHGGADAGYRAHFLRAPQQELTLAVLCNFAEATPQRLCEQLLDICLADRIRQGGSSTEAPKDSELDERAGLYYDPLSGDTLRLNATDGKLHLEFYGNTLPLIALDTRRYSLEGYSTFTLEFDAVVPSRVSTGGNSPLVYERVEPAAPTETDLAELAGDFHSDELDVDYSFSVDAGALVLRRKKFVGVPLTPTVRDAFTDGFARFVFTRGEDDVVNGMRVSTGRSWGIAFMRVDPA